MSTKVFLHWVEVHLELIIDFEMQMYSTYDAVSYIIIDNISSIADCIFALCWWPVGSIIIRDGKVLLSEGRSSICVLFMIKLPFLPSCGQYLINIKLLWKDFDKVSWKIFNFLTKTSLSGLRLDLDEMLCSVLISLVKIQNWPLAL